MLLDPANKLLQGEETDLFNWTDTCVNCCGLCACEEGLPTLWDTVTARATATSSTILTIRRRKVSKDFDLHVVEETTGSKVNDKTKLQRRYFSALDHVLGVPM